MFMYFKAISSHLYSYILMFFETFLIMLLSVSVSSSLHDSHLIVIKGKARVLGSGEPGFLRDLLQHQDILKGPPDFDLLGMMIPSRKAFRFYIDFPSFLLLMILVIFQVAFTSLFSTLCLFFLLFSPFKWSSVLPLLYFVIFSVF